MGRKLLRDGTQSESSFQTQLHQVARLVGYEHTYHTWNSMHSQDGFPDSFLHRSGTPDRRERWLIVELKSQTGLVKAAQAQWLDLFTTIPQFETYLWRPSDWEDIQRILECSMHILLDPTCWWVRRQTEKIVQPKLPGLPGTGRKRTGHYRFAMNGDVL